MKISRQVIDHYLQNITVGWFDDEDLPPDDVSEYRPLVDEMILHARNRNDLDHLKLGLAYLFHASDNIVEQFEGGRYPYDAEELREIIEFTYLTIWPGEAMPSSQPPIELLDIPIEEWWQHGNQNSCLS